MNGRSAQPNICRGSHPVHRGEPAPAGRRPERARRWRAWRRDEAELDHRQQSLMKRASEVPPEVDSFGVRRSTAVNGCGHHVGERAGLGDEHVGVRRFPVDRQRTLPSAALAARCSTSAFSEA